ncbi:MAG: hypothetical protein PHQ98_04130 [Candidatus ainarchaeum sp.]|nr:hypothetical protein [Candidatus ainarchaeum sp.]
MQNAILKKSQKCKNFSECHERLLFLLLTEKKYYTKDEILCLANYNLKELDKILDDLEKNGLIKIEGWLVKINDEEQIKEMLIS